MVKPMISLSMLGLAYGSRIESDAGYRVDPIVFTSQHPREVDVEPLDSNNNELRSFVTDSLNVSGDKAEHVVSFVDKHWPSSHIYDHDRNKVATRVLSLVMAPRRRAAAPQEPRPAVAPTQPPAAGEGPAACHRHAYCVGVHDGDCCPNAAGVRESCCDFEPDLGVKKAVAEHRSTVPGEELQRALHGGHFLGPLKETTCENLEALTSEIGKALHECPGLCEATNGCIGFTYLDTTKKCALFKKCTPVASGDTTMVFVRNFDGMTPHKLPTRKVKGEGGNFFVIGDWGSESCPGKASMHYVHKGIEKKSEKWLADHNAQKNVAGAMGKRGQQVTPFLVLNAGDNFYWGGVFDKQLGGNYIHDKDSFQKAFEKVYTDPSLLVPWLGILGNHDYGGEGCFSDLRAQFDYTIKDMLVNNRWKMPSPYYSHQVHFDQHSAEYFLLDSNIVDAESGRGGAGGGICDQMICLEYSKEATGGRGWTTPAEDCKRWFTKMWEDQRTWLDRALTASTANWKIIMTHHKPTGNIANLIRDGVTKHGVQLLIGSHTHELGFYDEWRMENLKVPLLVVGAGGGAQSAPGCGDATHCSLVHRYGFADVEVKINQLTMRLFEHDGAKVMEKNICIDGKVQDGECSSSFTPVKPPQTGGDSTGGGGAAAAGGGGAAAGGGSSSGSKSGGGGSSSSKKGTKTWKQWRADQWRTRKWRYMLLCLVVLGACGAAGYIATQGEAAPVEGAATVPADGAYNGETEMGAQ